MADFSTVFEALVAESPDGAALTRDGLYAFVNAALADLLGVSAADLIGQPIEIQMPAEDRPTLRSWLEDSDKGTAELRFVHSDGTLRLLALTPIRRSSVGEGPEGFIARDVTKKRRVETDLLVADRMMSIGALAAGVAHDINNPLSYVLGNLDFLRGELPQLLHGHPPDLARDLREAVDEAQEGAERVKRIVSDLRSFARADTGTIRELDVARVVNAAVNMAFVEIRHRARLEKSLEPLPVVRANEARLGQVVLNLLLNSVHAMREGQQERNFIRVATWEDSGMACIEVSDNGPGIPEELIGRVFDPFFTTKPRGIGTGLGLAMVHGVVTELGGTVTVDSRLGEGTKFLVRLPSVCFTDDAADVQQDTGDLESPVARVLVIDDDPLITTILRRSLRREGHAVEAEEGGQAAIGRLEQDDDFDVIFCDLLMPGLSGIEVYDWVKTHYPHLADRIVFMSGGVFTERVHAFLEAVDNARVDKPFELDEVTRLVRRCTRALRNHQPEI